MNLPDSVSSDGNLDILQADVCGEIQGLAPPLADGDGGENQGPNQPPALAAAGGGALQPLHTLSRQDFTYNRWPKLGHGTTGIVYKGRLTHGEQELVAVKKLFRKKPGQRRIADASFDAVCSRPMHTWLRLPSEM